MEQTKNILVSPAPAKTWYWLRMNDRRTPISPEIVIVSPKVKAQENVAVCDDNEQYLQMIEGGMDPVGKDLKMLSDENLSSCQVFTAEGASRVRLMYDLTEDKTSLSRVALDVPEGKDMICVMDYESRNVEGAALIQTAIRVGKNAHLTLVQIHRCADTFKLFTDIQGNVYDNGKIDVITLVISGKENTAGYRLELVGNKAEAELHTGYQVNEDHIVDLNYYVPHLGRKTLSTILADGVLRDTSRKLFKGTIDFRNGSFGSKGSERENVLLIDETVSNQTLPVILCSEDDVEGTHGASIGKLDDATLYYLQSRGMDTDTIYEMIAQARIQAVAALIPDTETREELETLLERN